jgi:hypothetical protein
MSYSTKPGMSSKLAAPSRRPTSSNSGRNSENRAVNNHNYVGERELTEEQKSEIKEAFELFDTDKDGWIVSVWIDVIQSLKTFGRIQCLFFFVYCDLTRIIMNSKSL